MTGGGGQEEEKRRGGRKENMVDVVGYLGFVLLGCII